MTAIAYETGSENGVGHKRRRCKGGGWRGVEIAAMVLGFIFVWPLGLAYLFYLLMRKRPDRDDDWARVKGWFSNMRHKDWPNGGRMSGGFGGGMRRTGNIAFDEYRQAELDRLEAERRRLVEEEREFTEFLHNLRRAKDREEFDRFMRDRAERAHETDGNTHSGDRDEGPSDPKPAPSF